VSDLFRIAQWSVGVFSIWFVLAGSFYLFVILSTVILLPLVSTAELRLDDFLVDELCGRSLYIGGVDRLGERTKPNHFYLFSGSLPLHEYHLASRYLEGSAYLRPRVDVCQKSGNKGESYTKGCQFRVARLLDRSHLPH
jgi:hypothetical protein